MTSIQTPIGGWHREPALGTPVAAQKPRNGLTDAQKLWAARLGKAMHVKLWSNAGTGRRLSLEQCVREAAVWIVNPHSNANIGLQIVNAEALAHPKPKPSFKKHLALGVLMAFFTFGIGLIYELASYFTNTNEWKKYEQHVQTLANAL